MAFRDEFSSLEVKRKFYNRKKHNTIRRGNHNVRVNKLGLKLKRKRNVKLKRSPQ